MLLKNLCILYIVTNTLGTSKINTRDYLGRFIKRISVYISMMNRILKFL